jgi:hypothetical protein
MMWEEVRFFWLLSEDTCNFIGVNWFLDNCEFKLINLEECFEIMTTSKVLATWKKDPEEL